MNLAIPESVKVWSQFIHPLIMWVLLATAIYALYLGLKVRQSRNAKGEAKKELIKGRYNINHYKVGSVLLALLTLNAFFAMAVTYVNTGKIFFGSHLIAGLVVVNLIVISALAFLFIFLPLEGDRGKTQLLVYSRSHFLLFVI